MPIKTFPCEFGFGRGKFIRTDNGTEQMAVNGSSTHAEDVWDGTGESDSGSDWTRGGNGSESVGSARSGTNGLDTGILSKNDIWWFDYGSDRDLENNFDSISFWINPQSFPDGSGLRCGWATSGSTNIIGNTCWINNYITNMDTNVWQRVTIPLIDFNLDGYAGRFVMQSRVTDGQRYYFDDFDMLNSTGDGPYRFRFIGEIGELRHVSRIILIVASPEIGWDSNAFADISNGLELGLILRQGIISTSEIVWTTVFKNNIDLFGIMHFEVIDFANSERMVVFTFKPDKASITLDDDAALEFVVRDDLSTITNIRAYVHYGIEEI